MLAAREDDGEILLVVAPADDIHHRLGLVVALRQGLVETAEELFVAIGCDAADEQGRAGVFVDDGEILLVVEADDLREVTAETLPGELQGQKPAGACLEMGMVGG